MNSSSPIFLIPWLFAIHFGPIPVPVEINGKSFHWLQHILVQTLCLFMCPILDQIAGINVAWHFSICGCYGISGLYNLFCIEFFLCLFVKKSWSEPSWVQSQFQVGFASPLPPRNTSKERNRLTIQFHIPSRSLSYRRLMFCLIGRIRYQSAAPK